MYGAYEDDIEAARDLATGQVEAAAVAGGWSSEATGAALDDVQGAYDDSTGFFGYLGSFVVADLGESVQADVVEGFWTKLLGRAQGWTESGADELRGGFTDAIEANRLYTTGGSSQTPVDVLDNAADTVGSVVDKTKDAAENGTLLPMLVVGVALAIGVMLALNGKR